MAFRNPDNFVGHRKRLWKTIYNVFYYCYDEQYQRVLKKPATETEIPKEENSMPYHAMLVLIVDKLDRPFDIPRDIHLSRWYIC